MLAWVLAVGLVGGELDASEEPREDEDDDEDAEEKPPWDPCALSDELCTSLAVCCLAALPRGWPLSKWSDSSSLSGGKSSAAPRDPPPAGRSRASLSGD